MMTAVAALLAALATPAVAAEPALVPGVSHPAPTPPAAAGALNDYPTEARAEYVFACMASNGQTRKALSECSCAIDHIASVLDYDGYVGAETVLTMRQTSGEKSEVFRETTFANDFVKPLRAAEAEAEILCFTPGGGAGGAAAAAAQDGAQDGNGPAPAAASQDGADKP